MSDAPVTHIDPAAFRADPYPALAAMRATAPITYVPELGATLFTRRDDIFAQEKRIDVFSSSQPKGLMTLLMGENMMRKDGEPHAQERRAAFPAFSPRTVMNHWLAAFRRETEAVLADLAPRGQADLVADFAMPVAGHALRHMTGLTNMSWQAIDRTSQAMIDGISNYQGDAAVEARCLEGVAEIDAAITARMPELAENPDSSLLSVQMQAGLPEPSIRANVKLAISGGQNEPRDAIAGVIWALLTHPDQLAMIRDGRATWQDAFEEYARWISPIGMSPREIARADCVNGVTLDKGDRVFLMYGSGNRDEAVFDDPDRYDITRDTSASLAFGAGPHFCAGAAAARALITQVALPMAFDALPDLEITGPAPFTGWAFRGLTALPVRWST
ncbi:MAG TPA: cytochrome P450 [Aliiroseovarius sp.]|nr:cytochrome P450 [Aliiroseovarius sp.]